MKFLLLILSLVSINFKAQSTDFELNSHVEKVYQEIVKMKLASGRALLGVEKTNGFTPYLASYADMIELMSLEKREKYEPFLDNQETRLESIEKLDKNSPYNLFLRGEIKLHTAFVKLKFGHDVKGAWDIIKSYKLLAENAKRFPNFLPNQKLLGILHILIGSTPDSYTWVLKILGLKGNVKLGLQELSSVAKKDSVWGQEAQLIHYLAKAYVLKMNPQELNDFQQFVKVNADNQLTVFFGTSVLTKEGRAEAALQILNTRPTSVEYLPLPFLEYQKAEILLMKGQNAQAIASYQKFLAWHKGFNFVKDGYYKIFLCHWLNNEEAKGKPFLEKVKTVGETFVEADKAAQKFAENFTKTIPSEKGLLKARFACDGGYYDQAIDFLKNYQENTFERLTDRAEFNYRKGRIYQRMGDTDKAIPFFERTIVLSEGQNFSFGATAALQLGYVFQEKGNKPLAKSYFEKALSYKKHEYKNSIDNKARAALNEF